jgi:hypothetical protein
MAAAISAAVSRVRTRNFGSGTAIAVAGGGAGGHRGNYGVAARLVTRAAAEHPPAVEIIAGLSVRGKGSKTGPTETLLDSCTLREAADLCRTKS